MRNTSISQWMTEEVFDDESKCEIYGRNRRVCVQRRTEAQWNCSDGGHIELWGCFASWGSTPALPLYAILLKEHSILQGHAASSVCIFVVTDSCSRIIGPNKALKELDEDPRRPRTNCHWLWFMGALEFSSVHLIKANRAILVVPLVLRFMRKR